MRNNPYLGWYPWPNIVSRPLYDYAQVLRLIGEDPVEGGPWAFVRDTERVQGWKLHLSSINIEASSLLRVVVPHLRDLRTAFKIARDSRILSHLNDGLLGMPQVGKFMTIYPESDHIAEELGYWLVENTRSFVGPAIVTDAHLDGIVYVRYGSFRPRIVHDRLGRSFRGILDSDGKLINDTYQIPFVLPRETSFPFKRFVSSEIHEVDAFHAGVKTTARGPKLLGARYLLVDVLNRRPKGSTFLAIDLATSETPSLKVIKEGKPYCQSDDHGRDVRSRLRHQQAVHVALDGKVRVPSADAYFEEGGRGYLPLQYVNWDDLRSLAENPWTMVSREKQIEVLLIFIDLITQVGRMHGLGYVHRDLSPSNIFLLEGLIYLTDFDLTYRLGDTAPPFQGGTPGYASPQQLAGEQSDITDDIYALGCEMIYLWTGVHPRLVITEESEDRRTKLLRLLGGADRLADLANRCIDIDADKRPSLAHAGEEVRDFAANLRVGRVRTGHTSTSSTGAQLANEEIESGINANYQYCA